jgi:hypothetical protein
MTAVNTLSVTNTTPEFQLQSSKDDFATVSCSSSMLLRHYTVSQIDKRAVLTDGSVHEGNTEKEKKGHVVLKFKNDVNGFSSITDISFKGSAAFTF